MLKVVNLDVMLATRKMSLTELSERSILMLVFCINKTSGKYVT
jgi:hypothetical protein